MKRILICTLALTASLSAENLFENSRMEEAGGWRGDKKYSKELENGKENHFLTIESDKREAVTVNQEVTSRDTQTINLTFRYRSKDYAGKGLSVRACRNDGVHFHEKFRFKDDGQWHEVKCEFKGFQDSNRANFEFKLMEGIGAVDIDDVVAEPVP